jgi:hypothetical protein
MTKGEIANMLKRSAVLWPSYKIDDFEFTVGVFHEYLHEVDPERVHAAMNTFARSKFMPSLPEIMAALEHLGEPSDNEALTQARTWWKYRDQMQFSNGSGYRPEEPQTVHASVRTVMSAVGQGDGWETRFRFAWRDR